jgi:phosphomannomutase
MVALARIVAFDLDDTLAPSKARLDPSMARLLAELLERTEVAVISGGQFEQFRTQLIAPLDDVGGVRLDRLHVLPTCGTQYYRYRAGRWNREYVESLSDDEKGRAFSALESSARALGYWPETSWGEVLEDRQSQVTFSALGQAAPIEAKSGWDPTGEKKRLLQRSVAPLVPDLEVRTGGSTSIDVTRVGRDKAFGITRLLEATGYDLADVLFFGDQLQEGGNDHPVAALGAHCIAVEDWHDTYSRVSELVRAS